MWWWIGLAVVVMVALGAWLRLASRPTYRLTATVLLPYRGEPTVLVTPTGTTPEDLAHLALAYVAWVHWSMLDEAEAGQRLLGTWLTSAVTNWWSRAASLLTAMPELDAVREQLGPGALTPVGERFDVALHRAPSRRHPVWVEARRPERGLAMNLPLSALHVLDFARSHLPEPLRARLGAALDAWLSAVGPVPHGESSQRTLLERYRAVATAWDVSGRVVGGL
ncbi:MAG TPA: hypothetical protein VFY20_11665 [Gemmatimonadales bacterium]|nr:hypothetical protein [Gemmatimonadales bacterium]